jgi:hypothetical protein
VGFVVGQSGARQVFSEFFGFPCSTNYSTITLMYHLEKMYNRPICGRSAGAYTNLWDLQRDLIWVKSHPTKMKKKKSVKNIKKEIGIILDIFKTAQKFQLPITGTET